MPVTMDVLTMTKMKNTVTDNESIRKRSCIPSEPQDYEPNKMRRKILFFLLGIVLPLVSSFITYTLVTLETNALQLDDAGALVITIILIERDRNLPIDLNQIAKDIYDKARNKRDVTAPNFDNSSLYQVSALKGRMTA
ncbi:hypothetical protein SK128_021070 [Halocaridina rubra]|uniref:Uncharacterized protein n=1 Tax=Halocaridina rubra TaxID=373956 RepID=A0AAN9A518_HALRR